jgi:hypothetical protein
VKYELEPGTYNLQWVYYYYNDKDTNNDLKMEIKWIEVEGLRDATHHCKKCENSFSKEGSDSCSVCPELNYYDVEKVKTI